MYSVGGQGAGRGDAPGPVAGNVLGRGVPDAPEASGGGDRAPETVADAPSANPG